MTRRKVKRGDQEAKKACRIMKSLEGQYKNEQDECSVFGEQ